VAARRYRGIRAVPSLAILLLSGLLADKNRVDLPGQALWDGPTPVHAEDDGDLVPMENGAYSCQECGKIFWPPPVKGK
jgi:hypothetical protein